MVSSGLCLRERFKLRSNNRRFNIRMYRGVATALVALAAFDYFYLDGKYLHYVHVSGRLRAIGGRKVLPVPIPAVIAEIIAT